MYTTTYNIFILPFPSESSRSSSCGSTSRPASPSALAKFVAPSPTAPPPAPAGVTAPGGDGHLSPACISDRILHSELEKASVWRLRFPRECGRGVIKKSMPCVRQISFSSKCEYDVDGGACASWQLVRSKSRCETLTSLGGFLCVFLQIPHPFVEHWLKYKGI